jgi:hypothetical protein
MDFDVVREIALELPDVEEGTLHGASTLKASGRLLTCPALHKSAEPNSLVVRIAFDQRAELLDAHRSRQRWLTSVSLGRTSIMIRDMSKSVWSTARLLCSAAERVSSLVRTAVCLRAWVSGTACLENGFMDGVARVHGCIVSA